MSNFDYYLFTINNFLSELFSKLTITISTKNCREEEKVPLHFELILIHF